MSNKRVICYGEVLWDLLPTGKVAGGAPLNVAFQMHNLGCNTQLITALGEDALGNELFKFIESHGIDTALIQWHKKFDTSTVQVSLDEKGSPQYEIVKPVAWDNILLNKKNTIAVSNSELLLFGSLGGRGETSLKTLKKLISVANKSCFDLNLRPPFFSQNLILDLLNTADLIKMNDDEVIIVADWLGISGSLKEKAQKIFKHFDLELIIVTTGATGAFAIDPDQLVTHPAFPVQIVDTVGCGDAFLATFLSQLLDDQSLETAIRYASAAGAFVGGQKGGTPKLGLDDLNKIINQGAL